MEQDEDGNNSWFSPLIKGWLSIISAAKHAGRRCWFLLTFHVPSNKLHNCFVDEKSSNCPCDLIQIFTGVKQWGDISLGVFPGTFLYMSTVVKKSGHECLVLGLMSILQAQEYGTYPVCENMSVLSASSKGKRKEVIKVPVGWIISRGK